MGLTGTTRTELIGDAATLDREPQLQEATAMQTQLSDVEFARFFVQSLDLLCIASFDGYFKCVNPAWTTCLGWSVEVLERTPFFDLVHPDDRVATLTELDKLAAGAGTVLFENRYLHQDGSYRWLRWSAQPMPERQRIYAIARDVTRRKRLEREILQIADRERERLGRDLHDGLCQTLAGIAALSATLSKSLRASAQSAASATSEEISKLLSDAVSEARNLAHGLGPLNMDAIGLDGALENLSLDIQRMFHVFCTFKCDRPFPDYCEKVGTHLFRIAQEAVNNAVSHGRAERVEISLHVKNGEGLLCVLDDGVGVAEAADTPDGIGIRTMAYRARLIGGSLEVRARAERGMAVTCAFPFP